MALWLPLEIPPVLAKKMVMLTEEALPAAVFYLIQTLHTLESRDDRRRHAAYHFGATSTAATV
ncbi:hypothetical protein [Curtobacterium flaccumfaciens]|uniref:hypothetical protein n=1 Tax=Curtobacterium flaccumfaciens TaxID=2035 RepID=UPI001BDE0DDF|nr:hypothetical protein [Curtobacterium flaccumfaciens]MBT1608000.1 hypothetical protein [Curtobacterium flaccumfaciens pv. betae]MBT1658528.1 hypothetical protein [Curtobacterium flaccumfaciens pv. betae]MCS0472858.1 hypothetical protein [Curtobacterium flaccumfaciens pv. betae]MCS0476243.1 hypothetical protein [Curtobacterium flaccumfaciens pv. betae]MCS0479708.1 hypothetical protein [Curtobacterium flaccumfaciens pv. betae]